MADEAFFVGTGSEILPIVDIDGFVIGSGEIGRKTRILQKEYNRLVRRGIAGFERWLTSIPQARAA